MKITSTSTMPGTGAGALRESWSSTDHDALPLPDGRPLKQVRDLAPLFLRLGIPGVSLDMGRRDLAALYAAHLDGIHSEAGKTAVSKWLRANEAVR
jgi:hypothetical protein